ncbi:MAG: ABC transporter permease [Acidobacteriota bacterium]
MRSGRLFLLKELVRRDFQSRYAGSILGFFWSFAMPIWQLLLFTFVFSKILGARISVELEHTESFGIFLFCGLLPWMAIHEGITRSTTAVVDNAGVIKKARLPLAILVLAPTAGALIHEGIAAAVFMVVLAFLGELGWQGLPLLLVALPLQLALTVGLGFLACAIHTFFRDTAQVLSMLLMGWFYLTPIVYSVHLLPEDVRHWFEINPLMPLVNLYRQALLGDELVWVPGTGQLIVVAGVILWLGVGLFGRLEKIFVDQV